MKKVLCLCNNYEDIRVISEKLWCKELHVHAFKHISYVVYMRKGSEKWTHLFDITQQSGHISQIYILRDDDGLIIDWLSYKFDLLAYI